MWVLEGTSEETKDKKIQLLCGEPLKVGRAAGLSVSLLNDKSISREHAVISIQHNQKNLASVNIFPDVSLRDLSSRYGTYVNEGINKDEKIDSKTDTVLKNGDKVQFGKLNNKWCIKYYPMVVTTSLLNAKEQVRKDILSLGGHFVKDWTSDCSILVMNELKLTTKVVCALACSSIIVTPGYLTAMVKAIRIKSEMPCIQFYLPHLKEPTINCSSVSFHPDPKRKILFTNLQFFFKTKASFKRMYNPIILAGGQALELNQSNFQKVIQQNSIVVKSSDTDQDSGSFIAQTLALLRQSNLNEIPESDVGLSLLYKDIERYCNPAFKTDQNILKSSSQRRGESQNLVILATETEDEVPTVPLSRTVIPESGESSKSSKGSLTTPWGETPSLALSDTCMSETKGNSFQGKENRCKRNRTSSSDEDVDSSRLANKRKSRIVENTEVMDMQESTLVFEPPIHSTQLESPIKQELRSKSPKTNVRIAPEGTSSSNICSVVPTTRPLPSLPISSLTFSDFDFNQMDTTDTSMREAPSGVLEPPSLEVGSPLPCVKKEPSSPPQGAWLTPTHNEPTKNLVHISSSSSTPNREKEKNPFALPQAPSNRRRVRTTTSEEESSQISKRVKTTPSDPFALPIPTSGRSRVASKQPIKRSLSDIENGNDNKPTLSVQPVIARLEESGRPFISKVSSEVAIKQECTSTSDVTFEKSLIVVQLVSLVRSCSLASNTTTVSSASSNGLPNFKKFIKRWLGNRSSVSTCGVAEDVSVLPQIIGGTDLVAHCELNIRKDSFLASQPQCEGRDEGETLADRRANEIFNSAFNLPVATQRRRGRR